MKIKTFSCKDCDKYLSCKSLCEAAKIYVNQDKVTKKKKEVLSGVHEYYKDQHDISATNSREELIILLYFQDHKRVTEISNMLIVSHQYVSKTVKKYQEIVKKNLKK